MLYRSELNFFRKTMKKMRIQTNQLHLSGVPDEPLDMGLRNFLGREDEYYDAVESPLLQIEKNTVYKMVDAYYCNYIFFLLPDADFPSALLIGPYLTESLSQRQILEIGEKSFVPPAKIAQLEDYFINLPLVSDDTMLFALVNVLAEALWGAGSAYKIVDMHQEMLGQQTTSFRPEVSEDSREDTLLQMKVMEARYAYEKELMENVEKGHTQRAEHMLLQATQEFMTQRISDPLRSMKNYCVICNTLMRKAAENGGVHPLHLHRVSSAFAAKIETAPRIDAARALISEMTHTYCRLTRDLSTKQYSPPIQAVVSHIEADLTGELSLKMLAAAHNINPSYLSTLFRKETGKTVTEYINTRRMEQGARLLKTTHLQIQTVAQHCGISDTNYFSKLFKNHYGTTPKQFREAALSSTSGYK